MPSTDASPTVLNGRSTAVVSTIIQTVTVVALFIAGFWYAVIQPIQLRLEKVSDDSLSKAEHAEFRLNVDRQFREDRDELLRQRESQVPRSEHMEHWNTQAATEARLEGEIKTLQAQLGGSYTFGDQLKHLQLELDDLRKTQVGGH